MIELNSKIKNALIKIGFIERYEELSNKFNAKRTPSSNDSHLINIFSVTVLEILGNDKAILKVAKQYMGEKTALLQMKVDKELGRL